MKGLTITKNIVRILLGLVFIASAALKLYSIDAFEVYVFGFKLVSFNMAAVLSRLLIGVEFFIGILLILKLYYKKVWLATLLMVVGFTGFLTILWLTGSEENCHCFGETIDLSPKNSIIKNIILIALLLFVAPRNQANKTIKHQLLWLILAGTASFVTPFIVSPPDFLYASKSDRVFEENTFTDILRSNYEQDVAVTAGRKVLCFFGTACRFCKLSAKKLAVYRTRHDIASEDLFFVFWGTPESVVTFNEEHGTTDIPYIIFSTPDFMNVTGGTMPLIVCLENNETVRMFNYRDLDEKWIKDFLSKE